MRKLEKLTIGYVGYQQPETEDELRMEILGLENVVKNAELRISVLKQAAQLNEMMKNAKIVGDNVDEKNLESSNNSANQTEQKT